MKPSKASTISKESLNERTVITVVVPSSTSSSSNKPQIVSCRRPITATAILNTSNASMSGVKAAVYSTVTPNASTHNLIKDATPAKYLLGNTTISVPILKNAIPLSRATAKSNATETSNKKIIGQSISFGNLSGKKINSNFVTLSPLNIQHTSGGRMFQAQIVRAQPSQQTITSGQRKTISDSQITKNLPATLTYSKIPSLSSLKVSQDMSLPTKIFEDESISPDSSIEQDENDLMLTEETIYTNEDSNPSLKCETNDNNLLSDAINKTSSSSSQKSISSPISLSNQDRIIEVDEMLNDDWKRKSSSSSPIVKSELNQTDDGSSGDKSQDIPDKQKAIIPVHVIIKSRESSQSPSLQPVTNQRLSSNLPQLSPLSQPNEITSTMANVTQQLRSIMSSINQANQANQTTSNSSSNQNKLATVTTTMVEIKAIDAQNQRFASSTTSSGKTETTTSINVIPTSFENVLSANRNAELLNVKGDAIDKTKIITESASTTLANKILTSSAFNQSNSVASITTTSAGSIFVVKQLRTVAPMANRSRSPVTVNSSSNKTQTISVVKSSLGGAPAVIISNQAPQQASSVIITQNKLPLAQLAKMQAENQSKIVVTTVNASSLNTIAVATSVPTSSTINVSSESPKIAATQQQTMSILSSTLSQPQQSRILTYPHADGHFTLTKKPTILSNQTRAGIFTGKTVTTAIVTNASSVSSANSTAAIQNILQSSLYPNQSSSGSILGATLSQPSLKSNNNTLLQTQLSNNLFRRSKSTDEVPGFLKETPAQIISKRHSSIEASNTTVKEEKDDTIIASTLSNTKNTDGTVDNCKYSTVTIVPHKSDDSQNVLLKQLLQNSGSTTSSLPTIVSRAVTSMRAPSLGVVSSLEAQLARPVILPVPATPNAIQSKPNTKVCIFFSFLLI